MVGYHTSADLDLGRVLVNRNGNVVVAKSQRNKPYSRSYCKTQTKNNRVFDSTEAIAQLMDHAYRNIEMEARAQQVKVSKMTRSQKRKLGLI